MHFVRRRWLPLTIALVLAIGGTAVYVLHGVFDTRLTDAADRGQLDVIEEVDPKRMVYEIFGPINTAGLVNYLDENAQPQHAMFTALPWSLTIVSPLPSLFGSVVVQGDSNTIGCRIIIDGDVRDEQTADGSDAQISCLVKAG